MILLIPVLGAFLRALCPQWARALQHIQRRGVNSMAIVIDGSTFGRPANYHGLLAELESAAIPTYLVRRGEPIAAALSQPSYGIPNPRAAA